MEKLLIKIINASNKMWILFWQWIYSSRMNCIHLKCIIKQNVICFFAVHVLKKLYKEIFYYLYALKNWLRYALSSC